MDRLRKLLKIVNEWLVGANWYIYLIWFAVVNVTFGPERVAGWVDRVLGWAEATGAVARAFTSWSAGQ